MIRDMRMALPIWWCLEGETQKRLLPLLSKDWVCPSLEFVEWGKATIKIESLKEIDRLMRQGSRAVI